ncbi:hypothetical protein GQ55_4G318000 [Panicum hallii var. hallii]|uniref:Uncharacterized protein n=2 Tax=Panicum sect. Panicum TaxID=2100772 RepID=A0A2T7E289_9POAL|nr:hypothetical protein GQ55_4G318000 [Panicum hallii var. hallii]
MCYIYHLRPQGQMAQVQATKTTALQSSLLHLSFTTETRTVPRSLHRDQMKTSLPLVAAAIVLLLVMARVEGIRLDAESHEAFRNQMAHKSGETAVKNTGDEPSGESMEETISEEKDKVGHRLPEIHVDYFGPRGHTSRHH